jgi:hypothetical protein
MRVYGPLGDPRLPALFPAKKTDASSGEPLMSRRHVSYAVLVVTSLVLAACSQPMAPRHDDTTGCRNVIQLGTGYVCGDNG